MEPIRVTVFSKLDHNAQIVAGFCMLKRQGWDIRIEDRTGDPENPFRNAAVVQAEYLGKTILYDLWDGYQCPEQMRLGLSRADFYFKRSFSREENRALFPNDSDRLYPLGFNYHVTFPGSPLAEPVWKMAAKTLLGQIPNRYFHPGLFEGKAAPAGEQASILFLTRLWDEQEPGLPDSLRHERARINQMRIRLIRALRQSYGSRFTGGLNDSPLSRRLAPELVVSHRMTDRRQYLRTLHASDICVGTAGLHKSIGWKTGEYVAAAKAIVHEDFCYEVPGNFRDGTHYLSFSTVEGCLSSVQALLEEPDRILAMKQANEEYYRAFLRPDVLVENTLQIVKSHI